MVLLCEKSTAADEVDDLDAIAGDERMRVVGAAQHDVLVDLDRNASRGEAERREQGRDSRRLGEIVRFAVDGQLHGWSVPRPRVARKIHRAERTRHRPERTRHRPAGAILYNPGTLGYEVR